MNVTSRILGEAMDPYEEQMHKDPEAAFRWAVYKNERFPEAEPYIAKDPWAAFKYANSVIKGRWPMAEGTISRHLDSAYRYAKDVIKGRWPEAEATLLTDVDYAFYYCTHVLHERWPEAEEMIAKSTLWKDSYLAFFPEAAEDWAMNGWIDWLDT